MDRFALVLVIIGAVAWGVVGLFALNPVAWLFGGSMTTLSRVVYTLVGLGGIWCVKFLFRERTIETAKTHE